MEIAKCIICGKNVEVEDPKGIRLGVFYHLMPSCSPGLKTVAAMAAINRANTADEAAQMYESAVAKMNAAEARRMEARARGDVSATFWHEGVIYTGTATPTGRTWKFTGAQTRQFEGRGHHTIVVTGMTGFNPRYSGKHSVDRTGGEAEVRWHRA